MLGWITRFLWHLVHATRKKILFCMPAACGAEKILGGLGWNNIEAMLRPSENWDSPVPVPDRYRLNSAYPSPSGATWEWPACSLPENKGATERSAGVPAR